jgi:hypothetical protein
MAPLEEVVHPEAERHAEHDRGDDPADAAQADGGQQTEREEGNRASESRESHLRRLPANR